MVSVLNKNIGGSMDLAEKTNRSADLLTPIHPLFRSKVETYLS